MSLIVDLSPQEEARFIASARQVGADPATLAERLLTEPLSPAQNTSSVVDEENAAAIALLESWLAAAPTDADEIRKAEEDRNEFIQNLNMNRIECGERPLFP
jgi:hypothetical protein